MPFMLVWIHPTKGRKERIELKGHPRPTTLKTIEECLYRKIINRRDLLLIALSDKPVKYKKRNRGG